MTDWVVEGQRGISCVVMGAMNKGWPANPAPNVYPQLKVRSQRPGWNLDSTTQHSTARAARKPLAPHLHN